MSREAARRLAAAARRRELTPRQLLALAMQRCENGAPLLRPGADAAVDLLLTPPARYARDDLPRLLDRLWPDAPRES
ncbi:MAG: hypothetical protein DI564_05950 [Rhodanobacter denitrificans]|uniref:Uncharacterized protein n=1 Tax=Rhodanobacter denitrificans TaxID=666685 RepID=A0A2W5KKB3_9GAMM|nr:MAG: hypothetical protein DI564_05950 [Rhodanobacter denitrificans]